MKLTVVGASGSIGKRRADLLEDMGHKVTRIDVKTKTELTPAALHDTDAVFICTPPNTLCNLGVMAASVNTPFFLEKPGAINHREYLNLLNAVKDKDLTTMIACNLRFTSEFRAIQEALPNIGTPVYANAEFGYFLPFWREGNYRTYYSCYKMAGGGILMDAIHELDYVSALFGSPLSASVSMAKVDNTGELDIESEDSATIMLGYNNGPMTVVHLDYLQRSYKRTFSCVGTKGRIDQTFNVQGSNAMYRNEMAHFLDAVKKNTDTCKTVESHLQLLEFVDRLRVKPVKEEEE